MSEVQDEKWIFTLVNTFVPPDAKFTIHPNHTRGRITILLPYLNFVLPFVR